MSARPASIRQLHPDIAPDEVPVHLYLLGGFRLERDAEPIPEEAWTRRSGKALLKLLALTDGHRLHREQVMEALWPDAAPAAAASSLHKAMQAARRAVEPERPSKGSSLFLHLIDDVVSLDAEQVWIDVDQFRTLAREAFGRRSLSSLESALAAYRGELLPEDRYEEWTIGAREELTALHVRLLEMLAHLHEERGSVGEAIETLGRIIALDPAHEETHRSLIRLFLASGDRSGARRQYERCREALAELGASPDAETESLYRQIPLVTVSEQPIALPPSLPSRPRGPFLGRDDALETLRLALAGAADGRGTVVLLGGEAGVGKTRLAIETAHRAAASGTQVLWGSTQGPAAALPYGPFVAALDGYLRLESSDGEEEFAAAYPELAALLPAAFSAAERFSLHDQSRLFSVWVRWLAALSDERALLLVLDDVQLADSASLQLLHHLARLASQQRWLIVSIYREEDVPLGSDFQLWAATLGRERLCRHLDLPRLARHASHRLARALLAEAEVESSLLDHLYARSLGNPLYVEELIQSLRDSGYLRRDGDRWQAHDLDQSPVPRTVSDLIGAGYDRLDEPARRLLALAAVAGRDVSLSTLRAAATAAYGNMDDDVWLDAVDSALTAHMVDESENGLAFRHPLFQETVYCHLSRVRRRHLHGALAAAIERQTPDDVEALAYHFSRSDHGTRALDYLQRAGDRAAALYAHGLALRHYREARERLRLEDDGAELDQKIGVALLSLGRCDEALDVLERAAASHQTAGRLDAEAATVALIGRVHKARASTDAGIQRLAPVVERLDSGGAQPAMAAVAVALADLSWAAGDYRQCLICADRALAAAVAADANDLAGQARLYRGLALQHLGRRAAGDEELRAALPQAERNADLDLMFGAVNNLAVSAQFAGHFEQELELRHRALDIARRLDRAPILAFATGNLALPLLYLGRWREARGYCDESLQLFAAQGESWYAAYPRVYLGRLLFSQGRRAAARKHLEAALDITARSGDLQAGRHVRSLLAEHDLYLGRPDQALARLEPVLDRTGQEEEWVTRLLPVVARTKLALGRPEEADELLSYAAERALRQNHRLALVKIKRARGDLYGELQQWDRAQQALAEGRALAADMPYPFAEARVLHSLGLSLMTQGDRSAAREALEEALGLFQFLGATEWAEHSRGLLTRLRR